MGNTLYVTLLGEFSLAWPNPDGPGVVSEQGRSSPQLWTFLAYLCVHRQRPVEEGEMVRAIWGEGKVVDAAGTLKNLLQRARGVLEELGFPNGRSVLLDHRGTYSWAPGLELRLDTDELDGLCAGLAAEPERTLPAALDFFSRCQGEFLPGVGRSPWVSAQRARCHDCYFHLLRDVAYRLEDLREYEEAIRLCKAALALEPGDERCHVLLMRLLHASGSTQSALWHYKSVSSLYLEQFGTQPPESISACYREISQAGKTEELSLQAIRGQLEKADTLVRPLYCEYSVFQTIYHLMARSVPRTGLTAQLAMLTVAARDGTFPPAARCEAAMEALKSTGLAQLREGDVCTRLGVNQYLLLLPSASPEDARMTLTRCLSAFEKTRVSQEVSVRTGVQPVRAIEL